MADNRNDIPMGWDDEIENDGEGFRVLPEGEYEFTVEEFSRARYDGEKTEKPCPMAELKLRVHNEKDSGIVADSLILNRKFEWKMCQFFTAIGARKHGETLKPNWNAVKGAKGRCKITVAKWIGKKDGKERESNNVAYLNPEKMESASSGQTDNTTRRWTPGSFGA